MRGQEMDLGAVGTAEEFHQEAGNGLGTECRTGGPEPSTRVPKRCQ
jgi:hypothetical protein